MDTGRNLQLYPGTYRRRTEQNYLRDPALRASTGTKFSRPSAAVMMKLIRTLVAKPVLKTADNHVHNPNIDR